MDREEEIVDEATERYLGCKQNLGQPVNDRFTPATTALPAS